MVVVVVYVLESLQWVDVAFFLDGKKSSGQGEEALITTSSLEHLRFGVVNKKNIIDARDVGKNLCLVIRLMVIVVISIGLTRVSSLQKNERRTSATEFFLASRSHCPRRRNPPKQKKTLTTTTTTGWLSIVCVHIVVCFLFALVPLSNNVAIIWYLS